MSDSAPTTRADLRAGHTFAVRLGEGRWGACRVLRAETGNYGHWRVLVAALAWWGPAAPALDEPGLRLLQRRTTRGGAGDPHLFWVPVREDALPSELRYLGVLPATPAESVLDPSRHADWRDFLAALLTQCDHDEAAGLAPAASDADLRARARAAARQHRSERRKQALANLDGDPFPPEDDGSEEEDAPTFRRILRDTLTGLLELGPDGDEVAKFDLLRRCIECFNLCEENIDSVLRDTICDYFDDLVWIAGLEDYGEALNCPWRDF
jgi:hypothetical protein